MRILLIDKEIKGKEKCVETKSQYSTILGFKQSISK